MKKNIGKSSVAQSRGIDRSRDRSTEYKTQAVSADKVPAGKHKGTRYKDLPLEYVQWGAFYLGDSKMRDRLTDELMRRKINRTK